MAFDRSDLYCVSGTAGDAPRLWTYTTTADTIATMNTAGYFNNASEQLNAYDIMFLRDSANVMTISFVNSNTGGVVDIVDGLTITATDTD